MVARFDIFLVSLDAESSASAKDTRPAVVVSPDEMNRNLSTVLIAPVATSVVQYPTRLAVSILNAERFVILDQIRCIDRARLVKKIGEVDEDSRDKICDRLVEMFAK
ncbi:MAG TPA: type II toxin-antitoxin system PemK/MazF family toxin [Pyrinomonadaceae bacterium]|nr:type II toxin-antitoxin system PemK/MazF family toxin [Pyrinomonadaceae bacterium]